LYVEDANGVKAELPKDDRMSYPSDFRFKKPEGGHPPYTVVIPYLEVYNREAISKEILLPLPREVGSSQATDISTNLNGFPVGFTRVERKSDTSVSVDVDVHYDPSLAQTLSYFHIRTDPRFDDGFGWESIEAGYSTMKTIDLQVKPGQTELRFFIAEPHILLKGPWRLPLDPQ
jgi:hypothetical protein